MADRIFFFFRKLPSKPEVAKNKNKMSKHIYFDLLITNMCIFNAFGALLPVK